MITTAVFDTKPYDREQFQRTSANSGIEWRFLEFRLTKETAATAKGAQAVCVFVNDQLDRPCLEVLAAQCVKLVALRCTGFNNVDLAAANEQLLAQTIWPHFWGIQIVILVVVMNYCAIRELGRALGEERIFRLFFRDDIAGSTRTL